jgi:hypothetical protein
MSWYVRRMTMMRKARGRSERLVQAEPGGRAGAGALAPVPAADDDQLSATDRALLHASLRRSAEQFQAGLAISAEEALAQLRAR